VLSPPDARSPADETAAVAAGAFAVSPGEDGPPVLPGAPAATPAGVTDAGVDAQRGEVDDEQADRGEDEAQEASESVAHDEDGDEDEREVALLHKSHDRCR